ncbi:DUF433 domain-containing protein [Bradyrhizobium sp. HKCCYLRH3097]|uniref:DUF433 domain-containing protein n=1 Tax=Bradyrhizobium sp. HKCCYLRH3097 TaxID=3420752 RepID=UPI003EBD4452
MHTHAVVERTRNAVVPSRRLLSLKETVILAGVAEKEKEVRNDISRGVMPTTVVRFDNSRLCFALLDVVTFAAVYGNSLFGTREIRKVALERLHFALGAHSSWAATLGDEYRCYFHDCGDVNRTAVDIDKFVSIEFGKACKEVKPRVNLYVEGLERVEESPNILGGAAVFKGSRLSVLHIGKMADRGVNTAEILEDYPALTEGDVEFAKLYYRAHPTVGRPRSDGAPHAVSGNE